MNPPVTKSQTRRRHPLLRILGAGALAIGASWLVYVLAVPGLAVDRVRNALSDFGLVVEQVDARSWFPGHLTLRNLVVRHALLSGSCRTIVKEIRLPHDPWRLLGGDVRVGTLIASGAELSCGEGSATLATVTNRERTTLAMVGMAFAGANPEPTTTEQSFEADEVVLHVVALSFGSVDMLGTFDFGASNVSIVDQKVELEEVWARLAPATATWQGQTRSSGVAASLQGALVWQNSRLMSGSSIALRLSPGTWKHVTSSRVVFEQEGSVRVDVVADPGLDSTRLAWQASLPLVRYAGAEATGIVATDVELTGETDSLRRPGQNGNFRLQSKAFSAERAGQQLTADTVSVVGALGASDDAPLLESARLTLTGARLQNALEGGQQNEGSAAAVYRESTFLARADVKAVGQPVAYTGSLNVQGDDAEVILALGRKADLPAWITSKFTGEPFSLVATLGLDDDVLRLDAIDVERGAIRLNGWWQTGNDGTQGAMLMQYGGLAVGLDLAQTDQVILPASEEWLQARTPAPLLPRSSIR